MVSWARQSPALRHIQKQENQFWILLIVVKDFPNSREVGQKSPLDSDVIFLEGFYDISSGNWLLDSSLVGFSKGNSAASAVYSQSGHILSTCHISMQIFLNFGSVHC